MSATTIVAAVKTAFTLVTQTGVTFTPMTDGVIMGGTSAMSKRIVERLLDGKLMVTTPHQAGGAYSERGAGGIYPSVKASAKFRTLFEQIEKDPRGTPEQKAETIAAIKARYGVN